MRFNQTLKSGALIRRYKRFLAEIQTKSGESLIIHCPNTGSMKNCFEPGVTIWYSYSPNPKRAYPYTWEISSSSDGHLIGVNTGRANSLVREAITAGLVPQLTGFDSIKAEVKFGVEGSRADFLVTRGAEQIFVEVKSVTLGEDGDKGFFPDAVSERGAKHLRELTRIVQGGERALLIYCVQHSGIKSVSAARHIDPQYAMAFDEAMAAGVEVIALGATLSPEEITLDRVLPVNRAI